MASVPNSQTSRARRLVFRASLLLAFVSASACANSDKQAQPQPDKPKQVAPEATSDAKAAEEKAAEAKRAEEKAAAEKAAAEKAAADKAAEEKKAADEKAAAKPAGSAAAEAPKADAKGAGDSKKAAEPSKTEVAKPTTFSSKTGILAKGEADKYVKKKGRPVIRLLDNGAEPRAVAAYDISKETPKPLQLAMDVEMGMESGDLKVPASKMPRMLMVFNFTAGARAGSDWPVEGKLTKVSLDAHGAQQEQIAKLLSPQLGSVEGLAMNYFIDDRGRTRDVTIKLPQKLDGIADQMLTGLAQTADSMSSPLPKEAIGIGAKWEVLARIDANGADILQVTTYTLEKRDGKVLSLDAAVRQFAAKEATNPPGMPEGATARLLSYKSFGSGKPVFDLGDVAPISGSVSTNLSMDVEIKMTVEGETEKQVTSATTKMSAGYNRLSP